MFFEFFVGFCLNHLDFFVSEEKISLLSTKNTRYNYKKYTTAFYAVSVGYGRKIISIIRSFEQIIKRYLKVIRKGDECAVITFSDTVFHIFLCCSDSVNGKTCFVENTHNAIRLFLLNCCNIQCFSFIIYVTNLILTLSADFIII